MLYNLIKIILFMCMFIPLQSMAQQKSINYHDGNWLNSTCKHIDDEFYGEMNNDTWVNFNAQSMCFTYIVGVIDGALLYDKKHICLTSGVTNYQLGKIVIKYIQDNPDKLNWPAFMIVVNSVIKSFPCKK